MSHIQTQTQTDRQHTHTHTHKYIAIFSAHIETCGSLLGDFNFPAIHH
jgi:hypothetical protein